MTYAIELVNNTIESCEKFAVLLHEENALIQNRDIEGVEQKYKEKRHLAAKVEKLLSSVKESIQSIKADNDAMGRLGELQVCVDNYQSEARKNMVLLQAAHSATSDFLQLVRRAIDLKKPHAQTYGSSGSLNEQPTATTLVNKDI